MGEIGDQIVGNAVGGEMVLLLIGAQILQERQENDDGETPSAVRRASSSAAVPRKCGAGARPPAIGAGGGDQAQQRERRRWPASAMIWSARALRRLKAEAARRLAGRELPAAPRSGPFRWVRRPPGYETLSRRWRPRRAAHRSHCVETDGLAGHGDDEARRFGVRFDLAPQANGERVDAAVKQFERPVGDGLQDGVSTQEDAARPADEEAQEVGIRRGSAG